MPAIRPTTSVTPPSKTSCASAASAPPARAGPSWKPIPTAPISGASLIRSGIQTLLADAQAGRFDMVLSEALDRLSRDQEDVAGVSIFTLSEGEINELHVGLKAP